MIVQHFYHNQKSAFDVLARIIAGSALLLQKEINELGLEHGELAMRHLLEMIQSALRGQKRDPEQVLMKDYKKVSRQLRREWKNKFSVRNRQLRGTIGLGFSEFVCFCRTISEHMAGVI